MLFFDCRALSLSRCRVLKLVKDPLVGVLASRWQLWNPDRRRPAILAVLPGRLFIFPFRLNCWWFSMTVCFPSCLPRPVQLDAYKGGVFILLTMGWGILTPKQYFAHGFPFATSCVVNGGLVQVAVTPSAPSHPMCNDRFVGGGFCGFM